MRVLLRYDSILQTPAQYHFDPQLGNRRISNPSIVNRANSYVDITYGYLKSISVWDWLKFSEISRFISVQAIVAVTSSKKQPNLGLSKEFSND